MTFTLWSQWWLMWNIASISMVLVMRRNRLRVEPASAQAESRLALGSLAYRMAVAKSPGNANVLALDVREAVSSPASESPESTAIPCVLRALDASARKYDVALLERDPRRLRLRSSLSIAPGTAAQLKLAGERLLGEVTASISRSGHFEVWVHLREVLPDSWQPHPDWNLQDSEESVAGSLAALNAQLMLHEKQRTKPECEPLKARKSS
jgi:hypothetical protein